MATLAEQSLALQEGGFSSKEIEDWKKEKVLELNAAGFSNSEI